jgi:uncharacterized protein
VTAITRRPAGVIVHDANGAITRFDHVVMAAHADQALAMLGDPGSDERRLLGAFRYSRNTAILHQDETLMPKRRGVWSSWNYIGGNSDLGGVNRPWLAPMAAPEPMAESFRSAAE